ncbi:MAG: hypothetical protein HY698_11135 [Deltaproteobacteria bacterium]|nr:hypothetical protein [Deltaproteobacteria bacterium]
MKPARKNLIALVLGLSILGSAASASAAATWIQCTPQESMTYANRVHVKCATAVSGIRYFAVSTSNSSFAARVLSTVNSAVVAGRGLWVLYDPADLSGSSIGCQNSDCRLLQAVGIK